MSAYVIGMDGGGTKTLAAAASLGGEVLAVTRSGPCNYQTIGTKAASRSIAACLTAIAVKVPPGLICRTAYYALAGADRPADFATIRAFLSRLNPAPLWEVENDAMAALTLASENGTGVVVVCGTGTNCIGVGPDGSRVQIGGLGRVFGDSAGGTEIASRAFGAAVRGEDGRGRPTLMASLFRRQLGLAHLEDLAGELIAPKRQFHLASLVPVVFAAAEAGDETACLILRDNGEELGLSALAALRRLFPKEARVKVVLTGGLLKHPNTLIKDAASVTIAREYPLAEVVIPDAEPVLGAVLSAIRLAGAPVDRGLIGRLQDGFKRRQPAAWTAGTAVNCLD